MEWQKQNGEEGWQRRWEVAFCDGFGKVDDEVIAEAVASDVVGSTAVVVVVSRCQIVASNCGDSRAILCRQNQIIQLTNDHKVLLVRLLCFKYAFNKLVCNQISPCFYLLFSTELSCRLCFRDSLLHIGERSLKSSQVDLTY